MSSSIPPAVPPSFGPVPPRPPPQPPQVPWYEKPELVVPGVLVPLLCTIIGGAIAWKAHAPSEQGAGAAVSAEDTEGTGGTDKTGAPAEEEVWKLGEELSAKGSIWTEGTSLIHAPLIYISLLAKRIVSSALS